MSLAPHASTADATLASESASWEIRRGGSDRREGVLAVGPAGEQARIHTGDCLYQRTVLDVAPGRRRQGERFVEYRRRKVVDFVDLAGDVWVEFADDYDLGRRRRRVEEVAAGLTTGAEFSHVSPEGFDPHGDASRCWEAARRDERTPARDLAFEQIAGRGSRKTVNAFLEGETAPVEHALGGVGKWKAAFVARDATGRIMSVLVTHFYNPSQNGSELCITRLANHPDAPENTSSWMLANVRDWAREQGYDAVATYSGVGANEGICYEAAGFEPAGDAVERDGAAWETDDDTGTWTRQKWTTSL